jgi:hypothetical protein
LVNVDEFPDETEGVFLKPDEEEVEDEDADELGKRE